MVRIELSLAIDAPPEQVFAFLTDLERLPEWQSSAVSSRADGPLAKGVHIHECRHMLGRDVDSELEVTACEPPRRLTLRALSGPVRFTVDHELSEQNGGTLLAVTAEGKATGMLRFAGPMVQRTADQELRQDFARLKEILEAG